MHGDRAYESLCLATGVLYLAYNSQILIMRLQKRRKVALSLSFIVQKFLKRPSAQST